MDVALLIHSIVRQTMVLVAQLATATGVRAPLAQLANQVFLDLVRELEAQGLGRKIIADMFGLALRSYHAKIRRLEGSVTDRGRSLWEAVYGFIQEQGTVSREHVLERFSRDDLLVLKGVLNDLTESGLVFRSGRGDRTVYKAAAGEELAGFEDDDPLERAANVVWIASYRLRRATREELRASIGISAEALEAALGRLLADGRVIEEPSVPAEEARFTSQHCVLPLGAPHGWEAAVFDHFQAMATAVGLKLRLGSSRSSQDDAIGGSTYGFDLWPEHPLFEEAIGLLREVRSRASDLRRRVDAENAAAPHRPRTARVTFYCGQSVIQEAEDEAREEPSGEVA